MRRWLSKIRDAVVVGVCHCRPCCASISRKVSRYLLHITLKFQHLAWKRESHVMKAKHSFASCKMLTAGETMPEKRRSFREQFPLVKEPLSILCGCPNKTCRRAEIQ